MLMYYGKCAIYQNTLGGHLLLLKMAIEIVDVAMTHDWFKPIVDY